MTANKFKNEEAFEFCTQMSMILSSGLSIQEGLEIIAADSDNAHMKDVCKKLRDNVLAYGSFYQAVKYENYFDSYMIHMIEIGEVSGHLDGVMNELADYYERGVDLQMQLKEALLYPLVLLIMMWVVVGIIVWKVLPIFADVLSNMGSPLPDSAMTMMYFGKVFAWGSFVVLSLILLIILYIILRLKYSKKNTSSFLSHFILTKKLYHNVMMARMTYALSLFVAGGYDMEESLSYLPEIIDENKTKERLLQCLKRMKEGESFVSVLQKEHLYEGAYANMIITGFHSGKSDDVMKKVASLYEKDVDISISSFLNTIEPLIVIFLSLIVGVILLSVMLPLMSIMSSLG